MRQLAWEQIVHGYPPRVYECCVLTEMTILFVAIGQEQAMRYVVLTILAALVLSSGEAKAQYPSGMILPGPTTCVEGFCTQGPSLIVPLPGLSSPPVAPPTGYAYPPLSYDENLEDTKLLMQACPTAVLAMHLAWYRGDFATENAIAQALVAGYCPPSANAVPLAEPPAEAAPSARCQWDRDYLRRSWERGDLQVARAMVVFLDSENCPAAYAEPYLTDLGGVLGVCNGLEQDMRDALAKADNSRLPAATIGVKTGYCPPLSWRRKGDAAPDPEPLRAIRTIPRVHSSRRTRPHAGLAARSEALPLRIVSQRAMTPEASGHGR